MPQIDLSGSPKKTVNYATPHLEKLKAALENPKCKNDLGLIQNTIVRYNNWISQMDNLSSKGKKRVEEMVALLNWYKNQLEVELIMKQGSDFIKRQKGQLKLDNSVLEEFLIRLIHPDILIGLDNLDKLSVGPQNAFMSLAFLPRSFKELTSKPNVVLKTKDQDFVIGSEVFYKFANNKNFNEEKSAEGSLILAVLATEIKVNLDKTMFQEAAGTAARLKQGCPVSKYFVLVEFLDMEAEDSRLTAVDNVFLLRHCKRLPFEKRSKTEEVERQHKTYPIDAEVVWRFVQEIQNFIGAIWYNPEEALKRGSFV